MATNTLHDWDSNMLSGSLADIASVSGDGYQAGTYIRADILNTILRETSIVTKAFIDYLCSKSTGSDNITALSQTSVIQNMIDSVIATSGSGQISPATSTTLGGIKADSIATTTNCAQAKIATDQFLYIPLASASNAGVVKAIAKTSETTQVAIDSNGALWYTPGSGGGGTIPQATENALGGIKAAVRNAYVQNREVKIDTATGKLYSQDTTPGNGKITIAWYDGSDYFYADASSATTITIGKVDEANSADKLSASSVGSSTTPVYFSNGVPTQCSRTIPSFSYSGKTLTITT